jgi:hypothetical protein
VIIFHLWSFMESHSWLKVIKQHFVGCCFHHLYMRCFCNYTEWFEHYTRSFNIIRDHRCLHSINIISIFFPWHVYDLTIA